MSFQDKTTPCRDCGGEFLFTAGEQEFYAQKGFTNEPTRCPLGRRARKEGRNLADLVGGSGCLHDVSGAGVIRADASDDRAPRPARSGYGDRGYGDRGYGDRGYGDRGYGDRPARRERQPYTGSLPPGEVAASVVRVDPQGRFLFVHVADPGIDVFVHSSFFSRLPVVPREGDAVRITVEASERGPRAASFVLDRRSPSALHTTPPGGSNA